MKRISLLIGLGFLIISACMVYLLVNGISLHTATLIKPSVMEKDFKNVSQGFVLRLFPEFQSSHYILWAKPSTPEEEQIFILIKEEYERIFHLSVQLITDAEVATPAQIEACKQPCWLVLPRSHANELQANDFLELKVRPLKRLYSNVTIISFSLGKKAPESCLNEKRLTFECLSALAIESAERKIKKSQRYFFLKKYNAHDFFLFIQESEKTPDR